MARGNRSAPLSLFSFQDIVTCVTAIIILITLMLTVELIHRKLTQAPPAFSTSLPALRVAIHDAEAEAARLRLSLASRAGAAADLSAALPAEVRRELQRTQEDVRKLERELHALRQQDAHAAEANERAIAVQFDRQQDRAALAQMQGEAAHLRERFEKVKSDNWLILNAARGSDKRAWIIDLADERFRVTSLESPTSPLEFGDRAVALRTLRLQAWARGRNPAEEYFFLLVRPAGIESFDSLRSSLVAAGFDIGFDLIGSRQTVVVEKDSSL